MSMVHISLWRREDENKAVAVLEGVDREWHLRADLPGRVEQLSRFAPRTSAIFKARRKCGFCGLGRREFKVTIITYRGAFSRHH